VGGGSVVSGGGGITSPRRKGKTNGCPMAQEAKIVTFLADG